MRYDFKDKWSLDRERSEDRMSNEQLGLGTETLGSSLALLTTSFVASEKSRRQSLCGPPFFSFEKSKGSVLTESLVFTTKRTPGGSAGLHSPHRDALVLLALPNNRACY